MRPIFPPPPQVLVPIAGRAEGFPVRRVYCIGRNYLDHVLEMGNDPKKDAPIYFMKPADALVIDGRFPYPDHSNDVHHEVELVLALGEDAAIFGYATGLDMTARDQQAAAKTHGRPWEPSKSFDFSAPISAITPMSGVLSSGAITLDVNGERRQSADLAGLIWSVPEIIAALSAHARLKAGDLIFTGTPSGVGPVQRGDRLSARIAGLAPLDAAVV